MTETLMIDEDPKRLREPTHHQQPSPPPPAAAKDDDEIELIKVENKATTSTDSAVTTP